MPPSASPAQISRRITRHQSRSADFAERQRADDERRGLRSGVAAARDDERHEQRQHDGLARSPPRRRPSPWPSAFRRGTAPSASRRASGSCAEARSACTARRAPPIRRCAGSPRVAAASATSSTSSMVTMPMSMPAVSVTGSADAVVLPEHGDGRLLIVGRLQRDEPAIHQVRRRGWSGGASRNSRMRMSSMSTPCSSTT